VLGMAGGALLGMAGFGVLVLWKRESIKAWGEGKKREKDLRVAATLPGRLVGKLRRFTLSFSHTLTLYASSPSMVVGTTVLSLIVQAANVLMVLLIGAAVGAPVPLSYYWILVPVVSLLGVLIPSIGGLGIREGGTLLFLAPLGIDHDQAILVGFLWTLAQSAANFSGVFFYLFGRFERFSAAEAADDGDSSDMDSDEGTGESEVLAKNMEVRSDGPVRHHPDQGRAGKPATAP